ncbi:hypothetical protein RWE15_11365 [Virgibacillus halophilus]|uniref:Homeodomain-like domain-containing protein n=1 Tax=Tigheibacillus halophilus TaxID=361280 RepID=A0ABU5C6I2_9BACI|nr:hypothetical protein [Virgibacillus halophilus]
MVAKKNSIEKYIHSIEEENRILKESRYLENNTESIFEFIHEHREEFPISKMSELLKVSTSGYYKWIKNKDIKSDQSRRNNYLKRKIKEIYLAKGPDIGSPLITKLLNHTGIAVSQSTVSRILSDNRKIWNKTYTAFHKDSDVILHFPNKDTVWDQESGVFYHQAFGQEEIRKLLAPKPLSYDPISI